MTKIYEKIIFPIILHGYETLFLSIREECRLTVYENWIVGLIFGPKRDETGE